MGTELESCPNCHYTFTPPCTDCPYCGTQLTHPTWKKAGAWILLLLIGYFMVKCHARLLDGFDSF